MFCLAFINIVDNLLAEDSIIVCILFLMIMQTQLPNYCLCRLVIFILCN